MMPAPQRLLSWGFGLSVVAAALAVYLRLQQPLQTSSPDGETFCYQSVWTISDTNGAAKCFTVSDGIISQVLTEVQSSDPSVEVRKGHAFPGLWDGHGHLLQYGEFLHSVDLFGSSSFEEVRTRVTDYVKRNPGTGTRENWVRGVGWDQMALGAMPTAEMLETGEGPGQYIMLDRVDVHCVWVSRAVLDLLPNDLPDVPGGEIVREPSMGVFCDNAMDVVMALWPRPDADKKREFIKSAMKSLHAVGLVGMHDAGAVPEDLALFENMSHTDDWTLRVYSMVECKERNTFCPEQAPWIEQENGMLNVKSVKLFADGALGSWGSAMIEPYSDRPDTSGSLLVDAVTLTSLTKSWSTAGYQVNIHAIGDLANRLALDAMEAALIDLCPGQMIHQCQADHRFRIEHAQIIHPHDQARMFSMGIIPSIQPTHATSDMYYAETRLGHQRTATEAYRMFSFLGLRPVFGSDFPVEPPNPFQGMYAALGRKNPRTGRGADGSLDPWYGKESLDTLEQALMGFTIWPAHAAFLEDRAGTIQEGAFADWIVLDLPSEEIGFEELRTMKVKETWVRGKKVYSRV